MSDNRLADYLEHMRQAASDACSFEAWCRHLSAMPVRLSLALM